MQQVNLITTLSIPISIVKKIIDLLRFPSLSKRYFLTTQPALYSIWSSSLIVDRDFDSIFFFFFSWICEIISSAIDVSFDDVPSNSLQTAFF